MRKGLKIVSITAGSIVALLLLAYLLINLPSVQTHLSQRIIRGLTDNINGDVNIERVHIKFFNKAELSNLSITYAATECDEGSIDTLLNIRKVDVTFSLKALLGDNLEITEAKVKGGGFYLKGEGDSTNVKRIFPQSEKRENMLLLKLKQAEVNDFCFTFCNPYHESFHKRDSSFIDFLDLDVSNIHLKATDISYTPDSITATISTLSGIDKSGFKIDNLTTRVNVGATLTKLTDLSLTDGYTILNANYFTLGYTSSKTLKYFVDSVDMQIEIYESYADFRTLAKLSEGLKNSTLVIEDVEGRVFGTVANLSADNISGRSGETSVKINSFNLRGLPDAENAIINIDIPKIASTAPGISSLLQALTGRGEIAFLDKISSRHRFNFNGSVTGRLNNLTAMGELGSDIGATRLSAKIDRTQHRPHIELSIDADKVDLAELTGSSAIGDFSGFGDFAINVGEPVAITIDTLFVKEITLLDYTCSNISAQGVYSNETFDGKVSCNDPNIELFFDGSLSINLKEEGSYRFSASLPYVNLAATKLVDSEREATLALEIDSDLQKRGDAIIGEIEINNCIYTEGATKYDLGPIKINSSLTDNQCNVALLSEIATANYSGGLATELINKIKGAILIKDLSNLFDEGALKESRIDPPAGYQPYSESYNLNIKTLNTQGICALLAPGLYIQEGTTLSLNINDNNEYTLSVESPRVAFESNYLKEVSLEINRKEEISATLNGKEAVYAGFKIDSTKLTACGADNKIALSLWLQSDTTNTYTTNLRGAVRFLRDTTILLGDSLVTLPHSALTSIDHSDISIKGATWEISHRAEILFAPSLLSINDMEILNDEQKFTACGTLSKTLPDSLAITMDNFDIEIFDQFLSKPFNLQGLISGQARLSMNSHNTRTFASFTGDSMYVYGAPLGRIVTLARWSPIENRYSLLLLTEYEDKLNLSINGFYRPEDSYLDINSKLDSLSITYFEPLISTVINNTGGKVSGRVHLYGPIDSLTLSGEECRFDNFRFVLDYTKVPYTLNGPITITQEGIEFPSDIITDDKGGKGTLTGKITYNNLKEISADAQIAMRNLHVLNTSKKENDDFYGSAYASGNVRLTGNSKKIELKINATTEQGTFLHIPISGAQVASSSNILTFKEITQEEEIDPYDTLYTVKKKAKEPLELDVALNINANEQADLWLEDDKTTGGTIKAKGSGTIGINVNPTRKIFNLTGNYTIESGNYHFTLMGLATRDFEVQDGSHITLKGAVEDTELDLTALYKIKANINRLISDTSSVSAQRTVICSIIIKGKLSNPNLSFDIEVPDLDPTTKVKVESALSTEGQIQKQFAALIATGNFVPDSESGITTTSTALYSNFTEMVTNELNTIFTELGIPIDLGFNYQPGDNSKDDIFDVAVSTQLFQDRVVINGDIGNNPYYDESGRDIRGNIDVEIKMDKKGKIRLNLFSHATDKYSNYLDESQRTGVGVTYQHDFNSFKDLFRRKSPEQREYEREIRATQRAERKENRRSKKGVTE